MTIEEFMAGVAPMMRKGWIAMDANGLWFWYSKNPTRLARNFNIKNGELYRISFNIIPVDDWKKSKRKVGKSCHI